MLLDHPADVPVGGPCGPLFTPCWRLVGHPEDRRVSDCSGLIMTPTASPLSDSCHQTTANLRTEKSLPLPESVGFVVHLLRGSHPRSTNGPQESHLGNVRDKLIRSITNSSSTYYIVWLSTVTKG